MDDARLDLLVRTCWPALVRTAYLLTGAVPAAEQLTRDALRRRLREAASETGLRDAVVLEAFRNRSLHAAGSAPFAESGGSAERMRAVLRQLPLDERTVLVLRHWAGLSLEQVDDVLRVPDQALRKREKRALQALRDAGLVPQDADPQEAELRPAIDAVADAVPWSAPPAIGEVLSPRRRRLWPF